MEIDVFVKLFRDNFLKFIGRSGVQSQSTATTGRVKLFLVATVVVSQNIQLIPKISYINNSNSPSYLCLYFVHT